MRNKSFSVSAKHNGSCLQSFMAMKPFDISYILKLVFWRFTGKAHAAAGFLDLIHGLIRLMQQGFRGHAILRIARYADTDVAHDLSVFENPRFLKPFVHKAR